MLTAPAALRVSWAPQRKGKKSGILKQVDKAAKNAAGHP